ncbi:hypothetical protein ACFOEK_07390 [Litoribrevibacter euphylliae]|uniref:DUF2934 domain-containing protein n=1 Tax=Litoribrevibacter euphylliae TaxID=1834034 RepID=A0ABV7HDW5_9GAMM
MAKNNRPEPGTPEFEIWLNNRAKNRAQEIFSKDIPEELSDVGMGIIAGPEKPEDLMPERTISEDIKIDKEQKKNKLKRVK